MRKMFLIFSALGLSFVANFSFAGVTWEPDVRLTNKPFNSFTSSGWHVATDSQNRVHVVWEDSRDGSFEIYYKRSLNGGENWEADVRLSWLNSSYYYSPSIATDFQNKVHVVWYGASDGEIYYKRSIDGGQSWENDVPLTVDYYASYLPSVATDSQNRVHIVWHDYRDGNAEIYYKRSLDGGQSWDSDIRLTVSSGYSTYPSITTDPQGRVHVAWIDDRDGNREIYYKRSLDGGQSWGNDTRLTVNSAYSSSPSITTDSQGRVHVAWTDDRDGNAEIYYKRSLDGDQTWGSDVRLTVNSASSVTPSIATDFQNRVHIVWTDYRDGGSEIYYKHSLDGGQSWDSDVRLTVNLGYSWFPSIATDSQKRVHVVWWDNRDGNAEIYYKRGTQEAKWTAMVYGAADNNLDLSGVEDLNELEYAGSENDVNMIYLLDRNGVNDTKLYKVQNDPSGQPDGSDMNIISEDISESARSWLAQEEDMGNPQTLEDFALWTMANYPADHYLISIWDHGNGIFLQDQNRCSGGISEGMISDAHGGVPNEYIDLAEFRDVLAVLYSANSNKKLNIVGLDACLMSQIETFYQMKDYVDYGIASEATEPGDGWEYGYPFEELVNNPDMLASNLASRIVDYYGQRYAVDNPEATIAAVDLGSFPNTLVPAVNDFAGYLYSFMDKFDSSIKTARSTVAFYNPEDPDLYHFSQLISQDTSFPLSLRDSANQVMAAYPNFIVNEWHGSQSPNAHGLSIWFPEDYTQNSHYIDYLTKIDFSQEKWDEFLEIYETPFEVLSLKLTLNTPIVHRGENLRYTAEVGNSSWVPHNLKSWADLTLPNGNPYPGNPVMGPLNLSLGSGQTLQRNLVYKISPRTPFGIYTTTGNLSTIDDLLLDQDSFNFQVTGGEIPWDPRGRFNKKAEE